MSVSLPLDADVPLGEVMAAGLLTVVLTAVVVVVLLRVVWKPRPAAPMAGPGRLLERRWAEVNERLAADEELLAELAAHERERDEMCEAFFTRTTGRPLQRTHLHLVEGGQGN